MNVTVKLKHDPLRSEGLMYSYVWEDEPWIVEAIKAEPLNLHESGYYYTIYRYKDIVRKGRLGSISQVESVTTRIINGLLNFFK
jgi:hypothetical protein